MFKKGLDGNPKMVDLITLEGEGRKLPDVHREIGRSPDAHRDLPQCDTICNPSAAIISSCRQIFNSSSELCGGNHVKRDY